MQIAQEKWILHNFDIKEELPDIEVKIITKHWYEMIDVPKEKDPD